MLTLRWLQVITVLAEHVIFSSLHQNIKEGHQSEAKREEISKCKLNSVEISCCVFKRWTIQYINI